MRGRTLSRAFVILDEAQNTTAMQMKMFLTRLGEGSRMVVTGDPSQIDLPPATRSGLAEALDTLSGVEGIGVVRFTEFAMWSDTILSPGLYAPMRRGNELRALPSHEPAEAAIDLAVLSPAWDRVVKDAAEVISTAARRALTSGLAEGGSVPQGRLELCIVLADDAEQRRLNRDWRGIDRSTNVLSFATWDPAVETCPLTRRCCSAMSSSRTRPWRAKPRSKARPSPTTSAISLYTACFICSDMTTPPREKRL